MPCGRRKPSYYEPPNTDGAQRQERHRSLLHHYGSHTLTSLMRARGLFKLPRHGPTPRRTAAARLLYKTLARAHSDYSKTVVAQRTVVDSARATNTSTTQPPRYCSKNTGATKTRATVSTKGVRHELPLTTAGLLASYCVLPHAPSPNSSSESAESISQKHEPAMNAVP